MKISYNWLKWYVPEVPTAEKLVDIFTYHLCEVESFEIAPDGDSVFDLNILPNRAHDLLSHHGIARELSGQLGIPFKDPSPMYKIPESKPTNLQIEIQNSKCRRYMGRIVRNVKVGPSPEWVVKHLESIGQRSINNIVDATNLCMYDSGQPMHAFDLDKMFSPKIIVRSAIEGEKITTLSDEEVILNERDLVIAEESGVLAIAGVKGGTKAEVDGNTKNIILEVANFDPSSVRTTARRLNILTDSAKRFENDLSPEHASFGMLELSGLVKEMFPDAEFEDVVDIYDQKQEDRKVEFSLDYLCKTLGEKIEIEEVKKILENYGYKFSLYENTFILDVPYLRLDITNSSDMAEEIGRILGYEKVSPKLPKINFESNENEKYQMIQTAREKLLSEGYSEVMTYAFTKKGSVEVARAPKGKEFLRANLSDGLKLSYETNRLNAPFLGNSDTKIFEIGTVFTKVGEEETHVAYVDKKGVVEKKLEEYLDGTSMATVNFEYRSHDKKFVPWSLFPFITRDIAVWVPEGNEGQELIEICKSNGTELLVKTPVIFDSFTKEGKTSIAVRLVFQAFDRTLKDEDVSKIMENIHSEIAKSGFQVR